MLLLPLLLLVLRCRWTSNGIQDREDAVLGNQGYLLMLPQGPKQWLETHMDCDHR